MPRTRTPKIGIREFTPRVNKRVTAPKAVTKPKKPSNPRMYTKSAERKDPADFADFGFGDTGLTTRS
jgi:hypothetical protein